MILERALDEPALHARHLIIDDFLPVQDADHMLVQMLAAEARFTPSTTRHAAGEVHDAGFRSSLRLPGRIGVDLKDLVAAIHDRFNDICAATGIAPFPVYHTECSIVAHRGGDFYKRHVDTGNAQRGHVRVVSCVYYLHRMPRGFSGGELAIYPIAGSAEPTLIEPVHNRLAVFPSFFPHEVLPTQCDGGFDASRFSVNCWLHREVSKKASA